MDDLKRIERNQNDWPGVRKEALDYLHIMLHGLRDMSEFENEVPLAPEDQALGSEE